MAADVDALLAELRAPVAATDRLHLNNAGVAPMTRRARDAGAAALERMLDGSLGIPPALKAYEAARASFARLLGNGTDSVAADDVSFFQTCAAALSQAAWGVPLARGDEIVIVDEEYPSNAYPWYRAAERAGATVRAVPVARVLESIGKSTKVVAVSWVQYSTGACVDLRALADAVHANAGWLVVDAIQGLGVIPFDLAASGADLVAGGTQKWLLGPVGHGFLACAPGRANEMQPLMHGAMTYGTPDDVPDPARAPRTDPRRFEPGTPLMVGAVAGAASIDLLLGIGIARVHEEALRMADLVVTGARERGVSVVEPHRPRGLRSPITTLLPRHKPAKWIVDEMRTRNCSVAPRGGGVRVAPHAHNGAQHVARFFELWDELDR